MKNVYNISKTYEIVDGLVLGYLWNNSDCILAIKHTCLNVNSIEEIIQYVQTNIKSNNVKILTGYTDLASITGAKIIIRIESYVYIDDKKYSNFEYVDEYVGSVEEDFYDYENY